MTRVSSSQGYRGRFAPSPTGDLHLGSASTALCAWLAARSVGGTLVLRIEDIDTARVMAGAEQRILDDLRWLGLDWDEGPDIGGALGPYVQSLRTAQYGAAITALQSRSLIYPCDCSRKEIAGIASAPHGDDGPVYPGTCRNKPASQRFRRPPAQRLATPDELVGFDDLLHGRCSSWVAKDAGDFVLRRGDGIFAYQLAVVVDDIAQGITDVVRGADLHGSAARQALLCKLLGAPPPRYAHVPLILDRHGERLAKRARGVSVRDHREDGRDPREVIGALARVLGLAQGHETRLEPGELVDRFVWRRLPKKPVRIDVETLEVAAEKPRAS